MPVRDLFPVPRLLVGDTFDVAFDWITTHLAWLFDAIAWVTGGATELLTDALAWPPPVVLALALAILGVLLRSVTFGVVSFAGLLLVISMELWTEAMETLALVLTATIAATVIAVPVGILAARYDRFSTVLRPVLDFMQTMPAFVYLVPAVTLFSIGTVPGVVVTIIFAMPPGVRLNELGIRQVDAEVVEAGNAFGGSPRQILRGIQLPLALPTIMAGVNQVIMLALSMAVIAGLIGANGLGSTVTTAISRLNVGLGVEAGLSVVVIAIYLDRITGALGTDGGLLRALRRRGAAGTSRVTRSAAKEPAGV
ncbi:ABC transporter permease [Kineococcus sp. TBRC 1896]|uniref:ABC transporter permease n=1 Tax=Kineococcus mangrovi TaxID=1660183 RepID=A0ABV4I5Q6_9ACTN